MNTKPILFLAFANDRDDRARSLRNLAEEARQATAFLPGGNVMFPASARPAQR